MKKYLFANWKMYLNLEDSVKLTEAYLDNLNLDSDIEIAVFPSALSFSIVKELLKDSPIAIGPQNLYWVPEGGYTGEISAKMYQEAGAKYALLGHSERRHVFGETNADVKNKMQAILENNLIPVLCVGETKSEKDAEETDLVIKEQLTSALTGCDFGYKELFIAYEPVWAIGTGDACSAVLAEQMSEKIKGWVADLHVNIEPVILYGGSVRAENVAEYLQEKNINGVLVGGASAKFDEWEKIVKKVK